MTPDIEWKWAAALDAVIAAPGHHAVLLENEHVRVLDTRIAPGDTVPLHTHRWPSVLHVLSWSEIVRRDETGAVVLDTRLVPMTPSQVVWSPALPPHTLENVGATEIHIISIELKRGRQGRTFNMGGAARERHTSPRLAGPRQPRVPGRRHSGI